MAWSPPLAESEQTLTVLWRLLKLAAPFRRWISLAVLLGSLTVASSIGLMAASAYIIAAAALHPSIAELAVPIVGVRFFGIARGVFRYLERLVSHHVNLSLLARLRVWFYAALEPLAPARLISYRSGDLLTRIVADIDTLQNLYVRVIAPPVVALVIAGFIGAYLGGFSLVLAVTVLGLMGVVGVALPIAAMGLTRAANRQMIALRSDLNAELTDGIQGLADLLAMGREEDTLGRISDLSRRWTGSQRTMAIVAAAHTALGSLGGHFAVWATLLIAIPMVRAAQLDGVYLPVLALAVAASFEAVLALPGAFQYLESCVLSAGRLFEVMDAPNPVLTLPAAPISSNAEGIAVKHLVFRYGAKEPLALDDVSFEVPEGRAVAIVGESGAGKSTLLNLLLRFWDYETGAISVMGRNLREYRPEDARQLFAVVSQSTYLFNTTLRENLLLARRDATEEEMRAAARDAGLDEFVCTLPGGYETLVGEMGLRLSGGERQRVAIARAVLKNAPFVLLDEPTVHLDAATECKVLQSLHSLLRNRTTLLITHRLVGLERMDSILVLRAGRVVERGTHAELLQADGMYARMWHMQGKRITK